MKRFKSRLAKHNNRNKRTHDLDGNRLESVAHDYNDNDGNNIHEVGS